MSDIILGKKPPDDAERDAIHVAVIAMEADCELQPGQRIGVVRPGVAGPSKEIHGIVDPYLEQAVAKGRMFWMCLLPNTVTGMRHHWNHRSLAGWLREKPPMSYSERWLREYATRNSPYYECPTEAFEQLCHDLRRGELNSYGRDMHCRSDAIDEEGLKQHAEAYLGINLDFDTMSYRCSC